MREGRMSLIRTGKALIPEEKHYGSHQKLNFSVPNYPWSCCSSQLVMPENPEFNQLHVSLQSSSIYGQSQKDPRPQEVP